MTVDHEPEKPFWSATYRGVVLRVRVRGVLYRVVFADPTATPNLSPFDTQSGDRRGIIEALALARRYREDHADEFTNAFTERA